MRSLLHIHYASFMCMNIKGGGSASVPPLAIATANNNTQQFLMLGKSQYDRSLYNSLPLLQIPARITSMHAACLLYDNICDLLWENPSESEN